MKVLVVAPSFPYEPARPYAGLFVGEQARMLQRIGVHVHVVTFIPATPWPVLALKQKWKEFSQIPHTYSWRGINVSVHRFLTLPRNLTLGIASRTMEVKLRRECANFRPDIIHVHFAYPTGLAAVRTGARYGVPVVLTVHGSDIHTVPLIAERYKRHVTEALTGAARVLAVSQFLKMLVLRISPATRVDVHYIGIDLSRFTRQRPASLGPGSAPLGKNVTRPTILYVGNLLREKGVLDLLQAFYKLKDLEPCLIYVGGGPLAKELLLRVRALGLSGSVRLFGPQSPERIPDFLAAADVVVLPSYREGLPLTVVEALACCVPVVATNVGGIPEVIEHKETGLLVAPGDVAGLAEAIRWVLTNRAEARRMAEAGRRLVLKSHDLEANTRRLVGVYDEVLRSMRGASDVGGSHV